MKKKLTSRKLWMCIAAMLASIGTSIAGLNSGSEIIVGIGLTCSVVSAAIYAGAEAYVDGKAHD